jgi:hypothetical protein
MKRTLRPNSDGSGVGHGNVQDPGAVYSRHAYTRDGILRDWSCMMRLPALQHTVRLLQRRPVFAAFLVATLALGIGGATAMFSVLNAVLLRPLPYPAVDRLMTVWQTFPHWQGEAVLGEFWDRIGLSWDDYQAARRARTVDRVAVYYALAMRVFRENARPEQLSWPKPAHRCCPCWADDPHWVAG